MVATAAVVAAWRGRLEPLLGRLGVSFFFFFFPRVYYGLSGISFFFFSFWGLHGVTIFFFCFFCWGGCFWGCPTSHLPNPNPPKPRLFFRGVFVIAAEHRRKAKKFQLCALQRVSPVCIRALGLEGSGFSHRGDLPPIFTQKSLRSQEIGFGNSGNFLKHAMDNRLCCESWEDFYQTASSDFEAYSYCRLNSAPFGFEKNS